MAENDDLLSEDELDSVGGGMQAMGGNGGNGGNGGSFSVGGTCPRCGRPQGTVGHVC